ncbi:MAG: hypothetical protein K0U78_15140 [Actinomycetia bacterium]|nr:hypothetical protein [Actinomycetes bacterium]
MSNFINPQVLAAESLDQLDYELVAGSLVYRDRTSDFSSVRGMKVGDFINIRTVTDFETNEFSAGGNITTQEVNQSSTQLQIEKHFDVSVEIGARERALNLDGIRKEIINPAMTSMAQKIDTYLLTKMSQAQGLYASANLLSNAADIALARSSANSQQVSKTNRIGLTNDALEAQLLGTDAFNRFDSRSDAGVTALQEATIGRLMGIDWFSSINFDTSSRTLGDGAGVLDNTDAADNVQGLSVITTDATTGTFEAGDKIRIAGAKRAFTVSTQTTVGATEIPVVEQINENLSALDGAAITVIGDGVGTDVEYQGVIFNPGAFGFAAPPLDAAAGDKTGVATADGMSIRVTEAYDISTKKTFWSFDMLVGAAAVDARKAMLLGAAS